jgi:drug/metabolite transporter (DMT)-like permease
MSGPFAKSLMVAGWSPTAAVTARLAGGALVMAIFATIVKPDWIREARRHARVVVAYGLVPIAGAQLFYYNAVAHLSVGVALLLEYTAPILVVGWIWATTRRRPRGMTLAGVGLAIAGIILVLDIVNGADHVNAIGVGWGLAAAICAACYFMMSDEVTADGSGLSAITLSAGGLVVGAVAVALLGLSGVMPLTFTANNAVVAGLTVPWWVPVIVLGVISTAVAYTLGISGVARLRPSFASLVGLSEVLFAVLSAWVLLGEAVTLTQAVGGVVVLLGLALARQGDRSPRVTAATSPDAGPIEEVAAGTRA